METTVLGSTGFGAAALVKKFRLYTIATILSLITISVLMGMDGPRISVNLPTPLAGVWERINVGVFLLFNENN